MIVFHEIVATVIYSEDAAAFEYGVIEYTEDDKGENTETVLQEGEANTYEDALTNVLAKLENVRRPTF
jgi:hypothetical protein